jgi:ParB family chromosome partitioning protein
LTELAAPVVDAFYAEEIGVGHALLLAKLQPAQQEQALANCFREEWSGAGAKAKRILLPVRHLQQWIEQNVLLLLKQAPFNKRDPHLFPPPGVASIAPSVPDTTNCSLRMSAATPTLAPTRTAMRLSWTRT